jgi:site-specific DNA recombinase
MSAAATETTGLACYLRVSSEGQKSAGTIENQHTQLDRYVRAHDLTVYGWYQDEAWSGTVRFADRPDAARLLADIRAGHVKTVLVTKLDRFGRNAREILNAVHDLEGMGATLVSLKENVDTRTSAGRFFLTVLAGVAELERDMILDRTQAGVERRLEGSAWMGGRPPYGLRVEGSRQGARLVLSDTVDTASGYSEVDGVRLGWRLLVQEDWTVNQIAAYFDAERVPTRKAGARWSTGTLYRMLSDYHNIYAGARTVATPDGRTITHPVPAILTAEQVEQARAALRRHHRYSQVREKHGHLLDDLLRCEACGEPYVIAWWRRMSGSHVGQRWRAYVCSTRRWRTERSHQARVAAGKAPAECVAPGVSAESAERQIWADVDYWIHHPSKALSLLAAEQHATTAQQEAQRAGLSEVQKTLDALQGERDTVMREYRKGRIDDRTKDRQLDEIAAEEAGHTKTRAALASALADATDTEARLATARDLLMTLRATLDSRPLTHARKREILTALVREIRVHTEEVGLTKRSGRIKRRAVLHVTYRFAKPKAQPSPPPTASGDEERFVILSLSRTG